MPPRSCSAESLIRMFMPAISGETICQRMQRVPTRAVTLGWRSTLEARIASLTGRPQGCRDIAQPIQSSWNGLRGRHIPPWFEKAIASVASAIDGAAPNNPAKLLGRKRSPRTAKAERKSPDEEANEILHHAIPSSLLPQGATVHQAARASLYLPWCAHRRARAFKESHPRPR